MRNITGNTNINKPVMKGKVTMTKTKSANYYPGIILNPPRTDIQGGNMYQAANTSA